MTNINDYNSIPTTEYRAFVDKIEDRIKYVNSLTHPDSDRLSILRGALLGLLEINPDDLMTEADKQALDRGDSDDYLIGLNTSGKYQGLDYDQGVVN
jgi:hypothetical protein